jgi:hypothetical protein
MKTGNVAVIVTLVSVLLSPMAYAAKKQAWEYDPEENVFVMVKPDGTTIKRKMVKKPKVKLVDKEGNVTLADINELAAGAKVLKLKRKPSKPEKVKTVVLREKSSGSSDCSFDALQYDDLQGEESFDWDCSTDVELEDESISKSCSFDASMDFEAAEGEIDGSMDLSGDCSYDRETPTSSLSWDCSFDASSSVSGDIWEGGDADGDASFSCSWSSTEELDAPLWACIFDVDAMEFVCESESEQQQFGATFSPEAKALLANFDFQPDFVDSDPEVNAAVECESDGGTSYSCSFESPEEEGDCSLEFEFESTGDAFSGDLSGDMSFSCSYGSTL